jgi:hypothetical protein
MATFNTLQEYYDYKAKVKGTEPKKVEERKRPRKKNVQTSRQKEK